VALIRGKFVACALVAAHSERSDTVKNLLFFAICSTLGLGISWHSWYTLALNWA